MDLYILENHLIICSYDKQLKCDTSGSPQVCFVSYLLTMQLFPRPGRYWSSRKRNQCPTMDDSRGITLRSLGGIFLATLSGLILSMLTLAHEVSKCEQIVLRRICKTKVTYSHLLLLNMTHFPIICQLIISHKNVLLSQFLLPTGVAAEEGGQGPGK